MNAYVFYIFTCLSYAVCHVLPYGFISLYHQVSYFVGTGALRQRRRHHTSGGQIDVRNHRSCRSSTHVFNGRSWSAPGRHRWAPGRPRSANGRHRSATGRDRWGHGRHRSATGRDRWALGRHRSASCRSDYFKERQRHERRGNNNKIIFNDAHYYNAFVCRRLVYSVCASGLFPCFSVHDDKFVRYIIVMLVIIFRFRFVEGRAQRRKHRPAHRGCLGPVPWGTGRQSTRLRRWSLFPTCHHRGDLAR